MFGKIGNKLQVHALKLELVNDAIRKKHEFHMTGAKINGWHRKRYLSEFVAAVIAFLMLPTNMQKKSNIGSL